MLRSLSLFWSRSSGLLSLFRGVLKNFRTVWSCLELFDSVVRMASSCEAFVVLVFFGFTDLELYTVFESCLVAIWSCVCYLLALISSCSSR